MADSAKPTELVSVICAVVAAEMLADSLHPLSSPPLQAPVAGMA